MGDSEAPGEERDAPIETVPGLLARLREHAEAAAIEIAHDVRVFHHHLVCQDSELEPLPREYAVQMAFVRANRLMDAELGVIVIEPDPGDE